MQDFDGQNIKVDANLLEDNIQLLIARLNDAAASTISSRTTKMKSPSPNAPPAKPS